MPSASATLDRTFQALSNPTRRAVLTRLSRGPATVSELAKPAQMALPSFMQHLRVLEQDGLIKTHKEGRVRTARLDPTHLTTAARWLEQQRELWESRLDQLDDYLETLEDPQ